MNSIKPLSAKELEKRLGINSPDLDDYIKKINDELLATVEKKNKRKDLDKTIKVKIKITFKDEDWNDIETVKKLLKKCYSDSGYDVVWITNGLRPYEERYDICDGEIQWECSYEQQFLMYDEVDDQRSATIVLEREIKW